MLKTFSHLHWCLWGALQERTVSLSYSCPPLNGHIFLQALYENMLVELPFASFFLSKLLGTSADVDIHHLASLDPEMYRNLLFLKSYEGDVEELGLNFTVVNNDLGEAQVTGVGDRVGWSRINDSHVFFFHLYFHSG